MRSAPVSRSTHFRDSICAFSRRGPPAWDASTSRAEIFAAPPLIAPNYLSTDKDVLDVVHGGRLLQAHRAHRRHARLILEPIAPDLLRMADA